MQYVWQLRFCRVASYPLDSIIHSLYYWALDLMFQNSRLAVLFKGNVTLLFGYFSRFLNILFN